MSRIRSIVLGLLVALVVGGVGSASASAAPVWVVKGSVLKASETSKATGKFSKLAITWEDKASKTKFEAECKGASGEMELEGGEPGKDKQKTLTFEECPLLKGGAGCKMKAGGVSAEELPGWPTTLEVKSGKTYDSATGVKFSLILEGCENSGFSKTWLFKGTLKAEVKNGTGKVELVLPVAGVEGDTLESEGATALLSGEGELKEKEGSTLEVAERPCEGSSRWVFCNSSGTELASGTAVLGLGGLSLLASTLGGAEVKIHCPNVHLHGELLSLGKLDGELLYLGCRLVKPTNCKLSAGDEKDIKAIVTGELTGGKSATITGAGTGVAEEFVVIEIVELGGCALSGDYKVTGSQLVELPKGEESVVEQEIMAKKAKSHLFFAGNTASYSGTANVMLASGEAWLNMFGV